MAVATAGWRLYPPKGELQELTQRVVCWAGHDKRVGIGTGGGTHVIVPLDLCTSVGTPLVLTPGGASVACEGTPPTGWVTVANLTAADVSGINPNTCTEIAAPTGLAVSGTPTTTAITVQWTAPTGYTPTGYRLAYKANAASTWTYVTVAAGTTTRPVTGLTVDTQYNFKVQALNGDVPSPFTNVVNISTAAS